jgi:hypothetical protein
MERVKGIKPLSRLVKFGKPMLPAQVMGVGHFLDDLADYN